MGLDFEEIYQALIKIGFSDEQIEKKVQEKFNEFNGFMTKEAVLFVIAKEHGLKVMSSEASYEMNTEIEDLIDYKGFLVNIEEISEEMENLVLIGKITAIFPLREFSRKDGSPGRVGAFIIEDNTGSIKVTLWDDQCDVISNELFQRGEIVHVIGAYSKLGLNENIEVHLSRKGKIILSP